MSFIKKYNCSQCNYGSDRKWTVKDHERRVHNNVNVTNQSNEFPTTVSVGYDTQKVATTMHVGEDGGRPPYTLTKPIEEYNKVVGIAQEWKKECEIKDNGIHARNEFLTANNSKLQDEYVKNKILIEQNQNIMEKNNQLELEKESLVEDGNNKVSAMGQDMGNLIHKYKQLKIKKKKPSNSNLGATTGCGYAKWDKTNKFKAPSTLKIGSSGRIAPTSFYITNDGREYYRGENELVDVGTRDICQRSKGIGGMLRAR